jgi:hypothetical protein
VLRISIAAVRFLFAIAVVVVAVVLVYFPATPVAVGTSANVTGYSHYTGDIFSLQYPAEWIINQLENEPDVDIIEISNDAVPARIIATSTPTELVQANMTQEEIDFRLEQIFPEHMLKPVISQIHRCTLIELEKPVYDRYMVVGHKAGTAVWTTDCAGIPTRNIMVGTIVGNIGLGLVYNAPEVVFDENLPIAEKIINSIRLSE